MIQIQNLNKSIQKKSILKDINVNIEKGKITSLIGPNGAGKSTLLSAITKLMSIDSGTVKIEEKEMSLYKTDELAQKISILKQTNHTDMNIKVEQLVNFGRFPYCKGHLKKEDKDQVKYALNLLQLNEIKDRNIKTLSGGQRQRAYIAMTIAQNTEYILLDEPLNNLDMKHSVQIMQTLLSLAKKLDKTIVIVLHDINFASCYSDYIIALKHGELVRAGKNVDVLQTEVLRELYEMDVKVELVNGQRICLYYDEQILS